MRGAYINSGSASDQFVFAQFNNVAFPMPPIGTTVVSKRTMVGIGLLTPLLLLGAAAILYSIV